MNRYKVTNLEGVVFQTFIAEKMNAFNTGVVYLETGGKIIAVINLLPGHSIQGRKELLVDSL